MIADPVFADMLAPSAEENGQTSHSHSEPSGHRHMHSHASPSHAQTRPSQGENDLAQDKVRSTLRSFVRDWSDEGILERKQCYEPCLSELEQHWKGKQREKDGEVKILVPGCGLGRLAMEIAARGKYRVIRLA